MLAPLKCKNLKMTDKPINTEEKTPMSTLVFSIPFVITPDFIPS